MKQSIELNIAKVQQRIRDAEKKFDRLPKSVTLIAASKTQPASAIRTAAAVGLKHFGENYVQEALDKQQELSDLDLHWHFIGPIQSNKTRLIAEHFDWVHSVDRLKIAQRLNEQRPDSLAPLNICLQLNISQESSKSGISTAELANLATAIEKMKRVRVRGVMAIPKASDNAVEQREAFAAVYQAAIHLQQFSDNIDTVSMGMSGDMEAAIAEGATFVRVGTDIFGPR